MSIGDMLDLKFDYASVKSIVGGVERYERLLKTPEGREFIEHLARLNLPSLISATYKHFNPFQNSRKTDRTEFTKLVGDFLRPNQGFNIIVALTTKDVLGNDSTEIHDIGKLVKTITVPNQVRNTVDFSRSGQDYTLPLNKKWENTFDMGFYTDVAGNHSGAVKELFQDIEEYKYFNQSSKITIIYQRVVDYVSDKLPSNESLKNNLLNSLGRVGLGLAKQLAPSVYGFLDKLAFGQKVIHSADVSNMKAMFNDVNTVGDNKRTVYEIAFDDVIIKNIHGTANDDERIDNYSVDNMTFSFNYATSDFRTATRVPDL